MKNEKTTKSTSDGNKKPKTSPKRARLANGKVRVDFGARVFTTNNCLFFPKPNKQ
jgi:hypothetical protein